jgi:hypothetical protein
MNKDYNGSPSLVISRLNGGLGNQLFQYAAGLYVAKSFECSLVLDTSGLRHLNARQTSTPRELMIHLLIPEVKVDDFSHEKSLKDVDFRFASLEGAGPFFTTFAKIASILSPRYIVENTNPKQLLELSPSLQSRCYLSGYWQTPEYAESMRTEILEALANGKTFCSYARDIGYELMNEDTAAIHVRRGDYLSKYPSQYAMTNSAYFDKGIERLRQLGKSRFFFFSDDIVWCKNQFADSNDNKFFETEQSNDAEALWAMSQASNFLISNSTYSWWAAWLSKAETKTVLGPSIWDNDRRAIEIMPASWEKLTF